jgi:hypothetical protein
MALKNRIDQLTGGEKKYDLPCDQKRTSCCG